MIYLYDLIALFNLRFPVGVTSYCCQLPLYSQSVDSSKMLSELEFLSYYMIKSIGSESILSAYVIFISASITICHIL